ncbi:MAG: glycosyltransferase family 39 protein [Patescibacteria group bacterium]|nr:glycosyltransferase family 39 protein [Patescibacteria group bacterium]
MRILQKLEKTRDYWFLLITSLFFFLLRLPSLFEPYWYGDEGIYQVLGIAMNQNKLLYKDIWDNKPPLLYFVYSIFESDQFWVRLFSLMVGLLTIIAFYFLTKKLFVKERVVWITTALFALLFGLPLLEGNIANAENFMLLPIIAAGILVLKSAQIKIHNTRYKILFFAGLLLGIAFLFKIVAVFDFAALLLFSVFADSSFSFKQMFKRTTLIFEIKKITVFILGFVLPVILAAFIFLFNGAISYFIKAVLFSNVGYVGYGNKFIIPQGFLILKLFALGLFCLFVYAKRKSLSYPTMFIWLWFAFSLFNAFFSQRPYTHYLLTLLPAFCLLVGYCLFDKKRQGFTFLVLVFTFAIVVKNFWFFIRFPFYYTNFISFITNGESVSSYQAFFDRQTPIDYELAAYINSNTNQNDSIFIWGNNAQVYKLTNKLPPGKYTTAYHITNYPDGVSNTKKGILVKKPKAIVIMPNVGPIPFSLMDYREKIKIDNVLIYERIF